MALEEAFRALVADRGMDVVMRPPSADQVGVLHCWWGSAQHCRGPQHTGRMRRAKRGADAGLGNRGVTFERDKLLSCVWPLEGSLVSVSECELFWASGKLAWLSKG